MHTTPNYLNPYIPSGLKRVGMHIVEANENSLKGYGFLVNDPDEVEIEIARWPSFGKRPVDKDSGDEAGTTEGMFICEWKGDILYGRNEAVDGHYILGYEPNRNMTLSIIQMSLKDCCFGMPTIILMEVSSFSHRHQNLFWFHLHYLEMI